MGRCRDEKNSPDLFFMVFIGTSIPALLDMVCWNTSFSTMSRVSRSDEIQEKVRFQINFGGLQNVGTVSSKYPTLWNVVPWYTSDNPYNSQKMIQFPTVVRESTFQTFRLERNYSTIVSFQQKIDPVYWLEHLKLFIINRWIEI